MDRTTSKLVGFAGRLKFSDLSETALRAAKARILSSVAVALAAYDMAPVRIARRLAPVVASGPRARVFGSLTATTPEMAAFVNAAMVRSLDMSDSFVMKAVSHPADALPAVLAAAEAEGKSGAEFLLGMIVSYEAQARFVEVVPLSHEGWDQTPIVALGAVLGAGVLLGLDAQRMTHAVSLAIAPNIALNQTRTGTLSMWKGMAGPQGARAGVFAAYLAREGMTGPDDIFEGKYGLWNQTLGGRTFDLPLPEQFDGHTFAVQQSMIKSFPTRFNCQAPVFAAQQLRRKVPVERIVALKIESIRQAFARWMDSPEVWKPQTRETADHSLPCTVAMALLDGTITPAMMASGRYRDADVLALMEKCSIELPDEFDRVAPAIRCCRLTATLDDGRSVVVEYRRSMDDDAADPGWSQAVDKYEQLTQGLLDDSSRNRLIAFVDALERQESIAPLLSLTRLRDDREGSSP